jgi:hypothetical protein
MHRFKEAAPIIETGIERSGRGACPRDHGVHGDGLGTAFTQELFGCSKHAFGGSDAAGLAGLVSHGTSIVADRKATKNTNRGFPLILS